MPSSRLSLASSLSILLPLLAPLWISPQTCSALHPPPAPSATAPPKPRSETPGWSMTMPLQRRAPSPQTSEEWGTWAKNHKESMELKYGGGGSASGGPGVEKRESGTNLLVNQKQDSSFFGSLALGTPPVSYNVILDTGSSDLWVADESCAQTQSCANIQTFDPSASSSFLSTGTPFSITYGSGKASGTLGADVVQMAGFSVQNQTFALCDTISKNLLNAPVSGLLGLGWRTIATSGATPFWQALVQAGAWDEPVMTFQLTRFGNISRAGTLEPGGAFTMGFINSSLHTGEIEYLNLSTTPSYWILPLTSLTVRGTSIPAPIGSQAYAAIDTGTTLIGGPSEFISAIYAQIPGSTAGTGDFDGYYIYPCSTTASVTVSFGGRSWAISEADFRLAQLSNGQCLGGFFQLTTGRSAPSWIFGDTFLKNVYSVFRYDPPSVGFAELSNVAVGQNNANAPVPTPTIGSVAVTATGVPPPSAGGATIIGGGSSLKVALGMWVAGVFLGSVL